MRKRHKTILLWKLDLSWCESFPTMRKDIWPTLTLKRSIRDTLMAGQRVEQLLLLHIDEFQYSILFSLAKPSLALRLASVKRLVFIVLYSVLMLLASNCSCFLGINEQATLVLIRLVT
jgi:hypothetical protein